MTKQSLVCRLRNARNWTLVLLCVHVQEVLGQQLNIFITLAQGRHVNRDG